MKVEVAGKLKPEDEKKDVDENATPAWGQKKDKESSAVANNSKNYPSLAKSVLTGGMQTMENYGGKIVVDHSKNAFASLRDDDEEGAGKKKHVGIAGKKQGESLIKPSAEKKDEPAVAPKKVVKKAAAVDEKSPSAAAADTEKTDEDKAEDCKIEKDQLASKAKYKGRRKFEKVELPEEELEDKENKKVQQAPSKKKKRFAMEEDDKPKLLMVAPDDF